MRSGKNRAAVPTLGLLLAAGFHSAADAQERERERAGIVVGAFITDRDTETRLDSSAGTGTDIDLEGDLGLDGSATVGRLGGYIWFKRRHRFDFSLFDLSRTASRRIEDTIVFGDETFEIDTVVDSESDLTIVKADYTFAAIERDRGFLGVTGGLYIAQTKMTLSEPNLGAFESEDLTAPLPVVGFRGDYDLSDRISVGGAVQWFSIDVDDASGSLRDFYVGIDYALSRSIALGIAYNDVTSNVEAEETGGFVGRVDWGYDGWLLYLKARFGQ